MRKILVIALVFFMLFTLVACGGGGGEETTGESQEPATEEGQQDQEEVEEENGEGEVIEAEGGKRTILKTKKDLGLSQESGPFTLNVTNAEVSVFEPSEDFKDMFDGKDKLTLVSLGVEVENKSEDTNSIYPDQGTITSNTKEQVEAEMLLSDEVGGDFIGEIKKEGEVFFLLDSPAEEITNIKYIVNSGHDVDFENFGESMTFEIEFE